MQRAKQFSADSQLGVPAPSAPRTPVSREGTGQTTGDRQGAAREGAKNGIHVRRCLLIAAGGVTITAVGKLDKKALREILAAPGGA